MLASAGYIFSIRGIQINPFALPVLSELKVADKFTVAMEMLAQASPSIAPGLIAKETL